MAQILSLVVWIFGLFISFAVGAWWLNTIVISLILQRAERSPPLHRGPLWQCMILLFGIWIIFAAATVFLVQEILWLLEGVAGAWLKDHLPAGLQAPGQTLVLSLLWLAIAVGIAAGLSKVWTAWGSAQRRRHLEDRSGPVQGVDVPFPQTPGRRIVILCDGTSNRPDERPDGESVATNIWKLRDLLCDDQTQTIWYQAGVGSDSSTTALEARRTQRLLSITGAAASSKAAAIGAVLIKLVESGTGAGISEMIVNGYAEIVRQYQPGDRIYLIGFSRGAFAARCIAGVISRCGLLRTEYLRYAPDVVQLYRTRANPDLDVAIREDMAYPARGSTLGKTFPHPVSIDFLGVFDTVASLGFPLWGWWFRAFPVWKNIAFSTDPAKACRNIYHALAMDERRSQFFPTMFSDIAAEDKPEVLKQVWFRGNHGDVGGGYTSHEMSDTPLRWMMDAMARNGLTFKSGPHRTIAPDILAPLHDELALRPTWGIFGTWPRWHPVPGVCAGAEASELHSSVISRADVVQREANRPDLKRLALTDPPVEIVVDTRRDWYRTGVVIESRGYYRIEYMGGFTRDAEGPPAGPVGQKATGADLRRLLGFGRRLPRENWMLLGATIAHPRAWKPVEKPFRKAIPFLLWSAPRELLSQIAKIGADFEQLNDSTVLTSQAPGGLLHLFANDWWQTSANNSGGPRLRITRIDAPIAGRPLWSLHHSFRTGKDGQEEEVNVWERTIVPG